MLDLFFRKYAWTANLILIAAAAWLTARMVNTIAGVMLRPPPGSEATGPSSPPPPRAALPVTLETDRLYRLIGQAPPAAEPEATPGPSSPQNCDDPAATPSPSTLRLRLVAAVLTERARDSLATLSDLNTRETQVVGVGDEFGGVRLLALERVREEEDVTGNGWRLVSVICNGGTKEYLELGPAPGSEASTGNLGVSSVPPPRGPAGAAGGMYAEGVRSVGPNRYEIDRKVLDATLSDLNKIATQARIVPSFKNGVSNGFKLFSIQPGSLYSAIGIQNGDVIQRINGYELNSPEKALELYSKLRESQQVTLEFERAGQTIKTEYTIPP
jgi:general secretion pathway protein C